MSEYDELVNGLRERAEHAATEGNMTATCDARYFAQSADAIRALEAEVERLKGVLGEISRQKTTDELNKWEHWDFNFEEAFDAAIKKARSALEAKP